jgi:predicted small lipoprotein YifL
MNKLTIFILCGAFLISSCGKEGALYLPSQDKNQPDLSSEIVK